MTCVLAVSDGRRVVVAGDSAAMAPEYPHEIHTMDMPKVFKTGGWVIGYSGSWLAGQVARYGIQWPEPGEAIEDLGRFVLVELLPEIRRAFSVAGYDPAKHSQWQLLIARGGEFVTLNYRDDLFRSSKPYAAIGSGHFVAYGALYELAQRDDLELEEKVARVFAAVCEFSAPVRGPFVVEST